MQAEIIALRHQLTVLQDWQPPKRIRFKITARQAVVGVINKSAQSAVAGFLKKRTRKKAEKRRNRNSPGTGSVTKVSGSIHSATGA
jgi:hypothetical protein